MKKTNLFSFVLFSFMLFHYPVSFAQTDSQGRVMKNALDSMIKESNYTRIPAKDFEELLETKVSATINEKFTFWFTVIGIFITAVAGLAGYAFNNKIKQLVLEQVKIQSEKETEGIKKYVMDSKKYTLRSDLEVIRKKMEKSITEANIIEARKLLEEIKGFNNPELLSEIVDLLAVAYSSNRNPREIEKLIETNEMACEIKVTTYMNAAILYFDLYELDGSGWYKENCLKYCQVSAKKVPHYGEPQGITIFIHAIDYLNNPNTEIKETAKKSAKTLIDEILTGSDSLTAYNTINRVDRDRANEAFSKYITELEIAIPYEFEKLYERARQYEKSKK